MNRKEIYIVKANGSKELFDINKLENSLRGAGAPHDTAEKISHHIEKELEDGMSTSMIYDHAFFLLDKTAKPLAARYSLKRALAELGPSGFPFEKFIGELFKARGYQVETNQFIEGLCAEHEIDLVAWNENKLIMVEAKFHNELGLKSDLKVALYIKARFDDLKNKDFSYGKKRPLNEGWLITNTKFTDKAIRYGKCAGVKLIGWNYPAEGNLQDMIEDVGLHPLTCLTSLSSLEKRNLLERGVVLCKEVRNGDFLNFVGIPREKVSAVIEESKNLCPSEIAERIDRFPH